MDIDFADENFYKGIEEKLLEKEKTREEKSKKKRESKIGLMP